MLSEISTDKYDLLVLDEAFVAIDMKLILHKQYFGFLKEKPDKLEVITTGRVTDKERMQKIELNSHLHTDAYCRKHYMNRKCSNCKRSWELHTKFCSNCGTRLDEPVFARTGIEL